MRTLVTGAAGFIDLHTAQRLRDRMFGASRFERVIHLVAWFRERYGVSGHR